MADQPGLYTLAEASELTGLSIEALRLRIKRGNLNAEAGNDGHPRVRLTSTDLDHLGRKLAQRKPTLNRQGEADANNIRVLEQVVGNMREQWERERAALEAHAAALRDRLGKVEVEAVTERARAAQAEREREEARVKAALAEGEAMALRELLVEARRPFWRRWLGS